MRNLPCIKKLPHLTVVFLLLLFVTCIGSIFLSPVFARETQERERVRDAEENILPPAEEEKIENTNEAADPSPLLESMPVGLPFNTVDIASTTPRGQSKKLLERSEIEEFFLAKHPDKTSIHSFIDSGEVGDINALSNEVFDIKIHFFVSSTLPASNRLTLRTGIAEGLLTYLRLEGATGYYWDNGELVIAYVSIPEGGSEIVTLTALPVISGKKTKISTAPVLLDKEGNEIAKGSPESVTLRSKDASILDFGMSKGKLREAKAEPTLDETLPESEVSSTAEETASLSPPSDTATTSAGDSLVE